ncbi:hypothetical protein B0J14DRAFT_576249 [Halenospora varia]|nr:hypothetical protein B0J14DRAFT_576249 [Halenospora varia]
MTSGLAHNQSLAPSPKMASRTSDSRVNTHLHDQIIYALSPQKDRASVRLSPPRSRVPSQNSARSHYSEDLLPEPLSIIKTPSPSPKKGKAEAEAEPQPKKTWEIHYISSPRIQCFKSNIPGDVYITVKPPKWNLDRKGRRIKMDLSKIKEFAEPSPVEPPCCEQSDFAVKPTATTPYNSIKSGSSFYSAESTMAAAAARSTPPDIYTGNGSPVPRKAALLKTGVVGGVASSRGAVSYGAAGGEVRSPSPTNTLLSDDGARRLRKYEIGPTVRQSKDAHDIIMGIAEPSPSPKLEKKSSIPSFKTRRGSFGFTRRSSSKNEVRSEEKEVVVKEATPPLPPRVPSGGAYSSRLPKPAFTATASRLARPTASSANREAVAKAARGKITKEMISAPVKNPTVAKTATAPVASNRSSLPVSGTIRSFKQTSKDIKSRFSSMLPGRRSLPVAVAGTSSRHSQPPVVGPAAQSAFGSARRVSQLGHVASLHDRASISITPSGYAKLATNNAPSLHGSIFNNAPSVHGSLRDGKTNGKKTDVRVARSSTSPEPRSPSVNLTTYERCGIDDDAAVSAFIADVTEELADKVDKEQVDYQRSEQATRAEHNTIARQTNITAQGTFHAGPSHISNGNGGDEPPTPPRTSAGPSGHYIDAATVTDAANSAEGATITDVTSNATAPNNAEGSNNNTNSRPPHQHSATPQPTHPIAQPPPSAPPNPTSSASSTASPPSPTPSSAPQFPKSPLSSATPSWLSAISTSSASTLRIL